MRHRLGNALALLARHARRELLRGPLGHPFVLSRRRLIQRLTIDNPASRKLWTGLASITWLAPRTRRTLFRLLYNVPFGPGDAAAPPRVYRRHVLLLRQLRATLGYGAGLPRTQVVMQRWS